MDLGCGRGRALLMLAERFPASSFVGYDLSPAAVAFAMSQAAERGLENVRFEARDLSTFDVDAEPEAFFLVRKTHPTTLLLDRGNPALTQIRQLIKKSFGLSVS
jgi:SAM-dependent methyltransferase